jgi:signal transduction histidine kinase
MTFSICRRSRRASLSVARRILGRRTGGRSLRRGRAARRGKEAVAFDHRAPGLPPARGDERRLAQALLNLVGNAIKFTDKGEVAIEVAAGKEALTFSVRDTGPGIADADQTKIFEEFQQLDGSITKTKMGSGLGLAIAKRIVEMHGGRIWVDSRPGAGATFSFTAPARVE